MSRTQMIRNRYSCDRAIQGVSTIPTHAIKRPRSGAYTVEFAVTVPILFVFVFGGLELSRYVFVRHALDQAAFEGARAGVVMGTSSTQAANAAKAVMSSTGVFNATVTVSPTVIDSSTSQVTVTVSTSFANNSWLPIRYFANTAMSSTVTLEHENKAYLTSNVDVGNNDNAPLKTL